jgi:putative transcriptional regulator
MNSCWSHNNDEVKEPLPYKACGLDDIYLLSGYDVETIDGEEYITVKDLDGLHRAIGRYLSETKKELSGKEVRFLRRQMDLTQSELARLFGCDAQQIARYEKDKNKIPGPADRLLRALYKDHVGGNQSIIELLKHLDSMDERSSSKQSFQVTEDGWKAAA